MSILPSIHEYKMTNAGFTFYNNMFLEVSMRQIFIYFGVI